ncbi:hypothetical protein H310_02471 [Aphanomyces invadans]|uniref:HSF-type DNA-binding domain-containing protein n=1 Tax=Aphanomyces invadans TaxID=157072 RepID=A0A024UNV3_9STRA|nr:hypothetical protein H310_02471 [Aphanomyces invadans]ETW08131.1 hypothetical protein H310_02471 [Aphanomyces invadans]|eukprot:XP_008864224.1 hypothetical protein H310_02471 [Aphanomyces invadans]
MVPGKGKAQGAPIFLQKTYTLFENAPEEVAGWANNGTTVVIKDPDEFAKSMLPKYFKHNNFASFVRQLNFYGFRKYKKDDILISEDETTKNWWEFYHDKFLRHAPELMVHIRRKTYSEGPDGQGGSHGGQEKEEVEVLKAQVTTLQSQLEQVTAQITNLTDVVTTLLQSKSHRRQLPPHDDVSAKRFKSER